MGVSGTSGSMGASGAAGTGCGDEHTWPDLDDNLVCGECKVLVRNMKTKYNTCDSYCSNIGRTCTGAWEEKSDTCRVKRTEDCQHNFGRYTSDAICECGGVASGSFGVSGSSGGAGTGCGDELTWPDLDKNLVCGECKVLVKNMKKKYNTCDSYCSNIGRTCTGA